MTATNTGDRAETQSQDIKDDRVLPLKIYGPELFYFTGKLEAVVRYMELPYQRIAKGPWAN